MYKYFFVLIGYWVWVFLFAYAYGIRVLILLLQSRLHNKYLCNYFTCIWFWGLLNFRFTLVVFFLCCCWCCCCWNLFFYHMKGHLQLQFIGIIHLFNKCQILSKGLFIFVYLLVDPCYLFAFDFFFLNFVLTF